LSFEVFTMLLLATSMVLLIASIILLGKTIVYYRGVKRLLETGLKPIGKARKRYVVFTALCEERVSQRDVENAISETMKKHYGVSIYRKASPQVILYDESTGRGVVRVLHAYTSYLIATLGLTKRAGGKNCLIVPIKTTGTLRKAREILSKSKI